MMGVLPIPGRAQEKADLTTLCAEIPWHEPHDVNVLQALCEMGSKISNRRGMQDYMSFIENMTDRLWQKMLDQENTPPDAALQAIIDHVVKLGGSRTASGHFQCDW